MVDISFAHGYDELTHRYLETTMIFHRFADDWKTCIFAEHPTSAKQEILTAYNSKYSHGYKGIDTDGRWDWIKMLLNTYKVPEGNETPDDRGRFEQCPYLIRIRRDVNDSHLPGLRYDHDQRELSFDWAAMFTNFFRECFESDRRVEETMRQRSASLLEKASTAGKLPASDMASVISWAKQLVNERDYRRFVVRTERHNRRTRDELFDGKGAVTTLSGQINFIEEDVTEVAMCYFWKAKEQEAGYMRFHDDDEDDPPCDRYGLP